MASHLVDTESQNQNTIPLILATKVLAQPRDGSHFVVRSPSEFQASELEAASNQTVEETQELFAESSGNLIYAGYPYDPYK